MASTVPAPVLDGRDGDLVTAESIGSLPTELSDRSNSNPAVVIIEAVGSIYDKLIYQLNRWPQAVIQKVLSLIGITLNPATAATVSQTFTLSAPQVDDTVIPTGTQISTSDGTTVFSTLTDLTIRAYLTNAGTISLTSGSTAVTGSGTNFTTDVQAGWQISTDGATWYTVANVGGSTSLTLTSSATSTVSGSAYRAGAVSGTVSAQATTVGSSTNIAASALNTLVNQPAGVGSTVNNAAAAGGTDIETTTAAIARAPSAFASRDVACSTGDYEYFAQKILGTNSRVKGFANTNVAAATPGYVTVALLSPAWTTSSAVSSQERASVIRDMQTRTFAGATTIDVPADIQRFDTGTNIPAVLVWRQSRYDEATVRANVAAAINNLLNPNTYTWGRTIFTDDLAQAVGAAVGVDRVHSVNGIPAVGTIFKTAANAISFTSLSTSATANAADIGAGKITANVTYLIDTVNKTGYLVTNVAGTTLTLSSGYAGSTGSVSSMTYLNVGDTTLNTGYTLPYSNLSTVTTSSPASIQVVGVVSS
jgi:hypothetical protein